VLLAAIIAAALPAQAATYGRVLSMGELLNESEQMVQGRVAEIDAALGDDGLIWTTVTLDVDQTLHPSSALQVSFRLPGGTVDELTLTVPGAPVFQAGQEVMVFVDGDRLRGFGQGALLVEDGQAWRGLGNAMEAEPARPAVHQLIGDIAEAEDCIRTRTRSFYEDGWALRGTHSARLGSGHEEAISLTLVAGLEYRFEACGDSQAGPLDLVIFDSDGRDIDGNAGEKGSVGLVFRPDHTGEYFLSIANRSLPAGTLRAGVALSLSYR
jgi:hypothetical protein